MSLTLNSSHVSVPLTGLPVAAAALDRDAVIVAANHRFLRLCGPAESSHSGRRLAEIVAESDRRSLEEAFSSLSATDDVPQKCTIKALRASPPSLWLSIDVSRLGTDSAVPYLACVRAESARRCFDTSGARRVPARCESSQTPVPSPVVHGIESCLPFLTTFSHELRGHLTAIHGWAGMAENGMLPAEKTARAFAVIARNALNMSALIESLFDLSRRAEGGLALKKYVLDFNQLVQAAVNGAHVAAGRRQVSLTTRCAEGTLLINGDRLRLEQIVRNLVENSLKFMPGGTQLRLETGVNGPYAELLVTDNDFGVSTDLPVNVESLCTETAAVPLPETELDLGLVLARELVNVHNGQFFALSHGRGRAATFIVRLPLAHAASRLVSPSGRLVKRELETTPEEESVGIAKHN